MFKQSVGSCAKSLRLSQNFLTIVRLVNEGKQILAVEVVNSGTDDFQLRNKQRLEGSMARSVPVANPDFCFASIDFQPRRSNRSLHKLPRILSYLAGADHDDVVQVSKNLT